jgi:hypothetical protein
MEHMVDPAAVLRFSHHEALATVRSWFDFRTVGITRRFYPDPTKSLRGGTEHPA